MSMVRVKGNNSGPWSGLGLRAVADLGIGSLPDATQGAICFCTSVFCRSFARHVNNVTVCFLQFTCSEWAPLF